MTKTVKKPAPKLKKVATSKSDTKEALEKQPINTLFQALSYTDDTALENFFSKMDVNQAVFVLIAATSYAQAKGGVYNVLEAEAVSVATRVIKKKSQEATEAAAKSTKGE